MGNAATKGWFKLEGQDGDRTLDQQLVGLDLLLDGVSGKTVLDLGCAEGLISMELARAGAKHVHGVDALDRYIKHAKKHAGEWPVSFEKGNLNDDRNIAPEYEYDIVLMLAICHKLTDPTKFATRYGKLAREFVVVRLPPATAPVVADRRSGNKRHDIQAALRTVGFQLTNVFYGTYNEWNGYFHRV